MTVSKLATPYMFQNFGAKRWWDGRSQKITTVVIHHAATTNFGAMPGVWATREASAHYGIGQNGEIRAYVDEENTAWHCGNGNAYSIGIECTNTSGEPNWGVSNATVDALVKLIQEIQSRRGKLQIVGHRDVPGNSTVCPGPSLYPRLQEIRNRVNSGSDTPAPTPTPSKPTNVLTAGAGYSVLSDGKGNHAHLDEYGPTGSKLKVRGWHIANYKHEFIILIDRVTGKEVTRQLAKGVARPDVNKAYNTKGNVGFDVTFDLKPLKGKSIVVLMRATNDPDGNTKGGHQDFTETRWYHDL
ncbi:N-acetylmuramoyl-L-alanine amidase [Enterococcus hulanensis]|nr:N-acetylmuramoyl-L-alanine amidase [Enterococcus hulanensis]